MKVNAAGTFFHPLTWKKRPLLHAPKSSGFYLYTEHPHHQPPRRRGLISHVSTPADRKCFEDCGLFIPHEDILSMQRKCFVHRNWLIIHQEKEVYEKVGTKHDDEKRRGQKAGEPQQSKA